MMEQYVDTYYICLTIHFKFSHDLVWITSHKTEMVKNNNHKNQLSIKKNETVLNI